MPNEHIENPPKFKMCCINCASFTDKPSSNCKDCPCHTPPTPDTKEVREDWESPAYIQRTFGIDYVRASQLINLIRSLLHSQVEEEIKRLEGMKRTRENTIPTTVVPGIVYVSVGQQNIGYNAALSDLIKHLKK